MGNEGCEGYQIERNMSSSEVVDPSSNSADPDLEWYSVFCCDDSLFLEFCSIQCDIASFRIQEHRQVSAACIVPLSWFCEFSG